MTADFFSIPQTLKTIAAYYNTDTKTMKGILSFYEITPLGKTRKFFLNEMKAIKEKLGEK